MRFKTPHNFALFDYASQKSQLQFDFWLTLKSSKNCEDLKNG